MKDSLKNMQAESATSAWIKLIERVLNSGEITHPRGFTCYEVLNSSVVVDMRQPVVLVPRRRLSYKFMAAEAWWILSGRSSVESIGRYCKAIAKFSDDGETFFGAYGPRIFRQIDYVLDTLFKDASSRQAVMTIWRQNPPESKDIPCTVSVQWLIRQGKLHCIHNMRSSDIWLGFPYDVFNFAMLSWHILECLRDMGMDVSLGCIFMNAASHHLYDKDYEKVRTWPSIEKLDKLLCDAGQRIDEGFISGFLGYLIQEYRNTAMTLPAFFVDFQQKLLA